MNRFHLLLGAIAASVATIVAVVIMANPAPSPADPFEGLHLSAPYNELADDEILNAPIVSYQSDSMEYKITYPGNWELDDTKTEFDGHILTDPDERVVVTITETFDEKLKTEVGLQQIANSIEESLRFDPSFTLNKFQRFIWRDHSTIFTDGERVIGGTKYHTREYNIVRFEHTSMLNVSITTEKNAEPLYEKALQQILNSLEVCHDIK